MSLNTSSHTVANELAQMLSEEQTTVDQLKQVLKQESDALTQHDIKAIETSASVKSKLLKAFSKQVQARLRYLSTQKLDASESGLFDLLNSLDTPLQASIKQQWLTLKKDFNSRQGTVLCLISCMVIKISQTYIMKVVQPKPKPTLIF